MVRVSQSVSHRLLLGAAIAVVCSVAHAQTSTPLYQHADAPIPARVRDLLGRMTLEEKVAQLQSNSTLPAVADLPVGPRPAFMVVRAGQVDEAVARRALGQGVGAFNNVAFGKPPSAKEQATQNNLIQAWVMKNTRLAIPVGANVTELESVALAVKP